MTSCAVSGANLAEAVAQRVLRLVRRERGGVERRWLDSALGVVPKWEGRPAVGDDQCPVHVSRTGYGPFDFCLVASLRAIRFRIWLPAASWRWWQRPIVVWSVAWSAASTRRATSSRRRRSLVKSATRLRPPPPVQASGRLRGQDRGAPAGQVDLVEQGRHPPQRRVDQRLDPPQRMLGRREPIRRQAQHQRRAPAPPSHAGSGRRRGLCARVSRSRAISTSPLPVATASNG